jgi:hypothetical protein
VKRLLKSRSSLRSATSQWSTESPKVSAISTLIIEVLRAIGVHSDAAFECDRVVILVVGLARYEHVLAVEGVDAVAATRREYRQLLHRGKKQGRLADGYGVSCRTRRVLPLIEPNRKKRESLSNSYSAVAKLLVFLEGKERVVSLFFFIFLFLFIFFFLLILCFN